MAAPSTGSTGGAGSVGVDQSGLEGAMNTSLEKMVQLQIMNIQYQTAMSEIQTKGNIGSRAGKAYPNG